jgi:hypothetical protein
MSRSALITDLTHFIGQPSAQALRAEGYQVFGTDETFAHEEHRLAAEAATPGLIALAPRSPEDLIKAVVEKAGSLDVLINNDAYPAEKFAIEDVPEENMKPWCTAPCAYVALPCLSSKSKGKEKSFSSPQPPLSMACPISAFIWPRAGLETLLH